MNDTDKLICNLIKTIIKDKTPLNLIVDNCNWVKVESITKYEDVSENERDNNSWWYLHGKLEEFVGYDKATAINCKSAGYARATIHWSEISGNRVKKIYDNPEDYYNMYLNGIIPVKIEGIKEDCIGFFWTTDEHTIYWNDKSYPYWKQRGLVVFTDDIDAICYAQNKYLEKSKFL